MLQSRPDYNNRFHIITGGFIRYIYFVYLMSAIHHSPFTPSK
jgi:hypothetical protein